MAKRGPKSKLTVETKAFIRDHYNQQGWSLERIGREIGYSISSVYKIAQSEGLCAGKAAWSKEADQFLLASKGRLSDAEIADRLQKTIASLNRRYREIRHQRTSLETEQEAQKAAQEHEAERIPRLMAETKPLRSADDDLFFRKYRNNEPCH